MSEIREDIITGNHVIIATERGKRPHDYNIKREKEEKMDESCPFCYGNEKMTPPEIMAIRDKNNMEVNTPGWKIRVVANKFAALNPDIELEVKKEGIYSYINGKGRAEVIIESPEHNSTLSGYSLKQLLSFFMVLRARYNKLSRLNEVKYIQVFKNYASAAGASLKHPHWQIITIPFIPSLIEAELREAGRYYEKHKDCIYCKIIEEEKIKKERLIWENEDFVAFCPYASRFPFETWILPRKHNCRFEKLKEKESENLASLLKLIIKKMEKGLDFPPYNLIFHTAPVDGRDYNYYHWHIEILPRLTISAGFELGTGIYINPTPPELAAELLRNNQV